MSVIKPHGLSGRRSNRQIGEVPRTAYIHVYAEPDQKSRFIHAAQATDMKLSSWMMAAAEAYLKQ